MKNSFLISVLVATTTAFSQVEIVTNGNVGVNQANPQRKLHVEANKETQLLLGNPSAINQRGIIGGAGLLTKNSNNYQWEMINSSNNYWGHTNTLDFYNTSGDGTLLLQLYPDNHVNINGYLNMGSYSTFRMTQTGIAGGANNFIFNTFPGGDSDTDGLLIMQNKAESSGIYFDGDFCTIFSPGDNNRLLRIYDEDGMIERFYIDASGVPFTNSDSTRKQHIENLDISMNKLAQLKGKKYHFKEELQEETEPVAFGFAKGMIPKDSSLVPIEKKSKEIKYDSSQREYFGFLAQDVEKVFPNLVDTNEKGEKFVSYTEFIPILVDGYNQQTQQLKTQQEELVAMNERLLQLEKLVEKLTKILDKNS